ncbi:MAG: beta-galactosidase [Clostridiales bacterium]|nr:beta-galactosidase [Clostridiales bacterium]
MNNFTFNEKYLIKDGKPFFPIMGELHYSRFDKNRWEDSLYKMKAGGIDIVSSYCIWIHHEEVRGEYDFSGNKDLRAFVETCKKVGIHFFLRIGPWSHAEVRNGGFPDWLLDYGNILRSNDPTYFELVKSYYTKLFEQVDGLFLKDGGPIIGIQIENEYGHVGGLTGEEGELHMKTLNEMAKSIGYDVPYFTATGWGGAVTGGMLPVMGGYCEAPWDQSTGEIEPSGNYVFTHERNDHNIGSDYGFGTGITYDIDKFPFLTAELGGGLQVTKHRRPVAHSKDIGAMSMAKLGSGVNLLGYYMYHGGTNPDGKLTTLEESRATGAPNDLPILNYDFRAPLRQYGQISETFKEIKILAMFTKDFGEELCELPAVIPEDNPLQQADYENLRYSYRRNESTGYVFVNNYQRRQVMAEHKDVILKAKVGNEVIEFPKCDVKNGDFFFYPFNRKVKGGLIKYIMATPLCRIDVEDNEMLFLYSDNEPLAKYENWTGETTVIVLTREEAKNAYKVKVNNKEHLIVSSNPVLQKGNNLEIVAQGSEAIKVYPAFEKTPEEYQLLESNEEYGVYKIKDVYNKLNEYSAEVSVKEIEESETTKKYELTINYKGNTQQGDIWIKLDYAGSVSRIYEDGKMINDHFYTGEPLEISLGYFGYPSKLIMEIDTLHKNEKVFLETWPEFKGDKACELIDVRINPEVRSII